MKILVTGANGYIGLHIVKTLLDKGIQVIACDLNTDEVDKRAERKNIDLFTLPDTNIYTFLGLFLVDIGRVCVFLFPFIINRIANISVRLRYSDQYLRVSNIIITFSIAIILQCGVISYFYTNIDRYIGLIFFLSVALYMRKSQD